MTNSQVSLGCNFFKGVKESMELRDKPLNKGISGHLLLEDILNSVHARLQKLKHFFLL